MSKKCLPLLQVYICFDNIIPSQEGNIVLYISEGCTKCFSISTLQANKASSFNNPVDGKLAGWIMADKMPKHKALFSTLETVKSL